jgi:hypothetical protein
MKAKLAFTAISQISLFGSRAAVSEARVMIA